MLLINLVTTIILSILRPRIHTNQSNPLATLPDWLTTHGHEFCHFIFEYAVTMQSFKDWNSLSPYFKSKLEPHYKEDSFCLQVLNDEVHAVINITLSTVRILFSFTFFIHSTIIVHPVRTITTISTVCYSYNPTTK